MQHSEFGLRRLRFLASGDKSVRLERRVMKLTYEKPVLVKRETLAQITAIVCPVSHPCAPPPIA